MRHANIKSFGKFTSKYNLPKFKIPFVSVTKNKNLSDSEFYNKLTVNHPKEMIDYMLNYYEPDFNILGYTMYE